MKAVTISTTLNANIHTAWTSWTDPTHVVVWNHASDDWHCPKASNDVRVGGQFSFTMAAKDGSVAFDFVGTYTAVTPKSYIAYEMPDKRKVAVTFEAISDSQVKVTETFDLETTHTEQEQLSGWGAILENYRKHTESIAAKV